MKLSHKSAVSTHFFKYCWIIKVYMTKMFLPCGVIFWLVSRQESGLDIFSRVLN